ncbi:MAG: hypothetical protein J7K36_02135 [Archaeoglobaceae archaeon]|nr:hypothetical protein [Archaeoglobaceae archaeon]
MLIEKKEIVTITIELYGEMDFENFFKNIEPIIQKEKELFEKHLTAVWKVDCGVG